MRENIDPLDVSFNFLGCHDAPFVSCEIKSLFSPKPAKYSLQLAGTLSGFELNFSYISLMYATFDPLKNDVISKILLLDADIYKRHYIKPLIQISTFFQYQLASLLR